MKNPMGSVHGGGNQEIAPDYHKKAGFIISASANTFSVTTRIPPYLLFFAIDAILRERVGYLESAVGETRRNIVNEVAAAAMGIKSDTTRPVQICAGLNTGIQRPGSEENSCPGLDMGV